ncbi:hypothetical protein HELRODRAFT_193110 [Helobdella robusta]|uniref:alpha-1,2-Mannosidase n=1 Tax=Helobdella robusta TaxID=6412 RepID=T1FUM7_HELRO|nr:hypothetical protein HELRODRAFT_193110 [Helobdella robusta]ESN98159.1 hypothetical protein HELRODRAFT_193110 [Helobdella robusta]
MYKLKMLFFLGTIFFTLVLFSYFSFFYSSKELTVSYRHFHHKKLVVFSDKVKTKSNFLGHELTKLSLNNLNSMLRHAWNNYHKYGWGSDELKPQSATGHNWMKLGLTIIDSLDTLYIMNFSKEYELGKEWVIENLHFNKSRMVDSFVLITRILGGLLSIYHLTDDIIYLQKIKELSPRLKPCFIRRNTKLPCQNVNLKTGKASTDYMSSIISDAVRSEDDLVHDLIDHHSMSADPDSPVQIGRNSVGYYEGLLKLWLQSGQKNKGLEVIFPRTISGIESHLLRTYNDTDGYLLYFNSTLSKPKPYMEEESCKLPGLLALASIVKLGEPKLKMAHILAGTCIRMHDKTELKLCPLSVQFAGRRGKTTTMSLKDKKSTLASSTLESLMYLARTDVLNQYKYYDVAVHICKHLFQSTWLNHGFASRLDVNRVKSKYHDVMDSHLFSQTFKYAYMILSNRSINFNDFVFTSAGHILPVRR